MRLFIASVLLVTAACETVPQDQPGQVVAFNGDTVTVRGRFSTGDGKPAHPTAAMTAQAKEQCSGATYLSAVPTPDDVDPFHQFFDYLYRC